MGSAFILKNYVSKNQQNKLFVYPDSGSDLFSFFKIIPISNKMDNYNYNNTETLVEYLLGAKNSAKSRWILTTIIWVGYYY